MNCEYCSLPTQRKIETENIIIHVCDKCNLLLKDPKTAPKLLRGHLCMKLRGTMSEEKLEKFIDDGIEAILKLAPD